MDLQGKVIAVLPERGGVSQRTGNAWKVQSYVIETHDTYPRKMVFDVFGEDRITRFNIQIGQEVMVSFDIDAHEYQGRWFNGIRAYDVRLVDPASVTSAGIQPMPTPGVVGASAPTAAPFPPSPATDGGDDDLPF